MVEYPELYRIANGIYLELKQRHPALHFTELELQAPGYAIRCGLKPGHNPYLFMVKVTRDGVLFDIENHPHRPYYSDSMATGMIRRLLEIGFENPRLMELVFEQADHFANVGGSPCL